jgi:cytochrome c peroxidase
MRKRANQYRLLTGTGCILLLVTLLTSAEEFVVMPALPDVPPVPADNPMTAEKIALGKQLYFDPRLSITDAYSCNSCHDLRKAGTDHQALSRGALGKPGNRSTPSVLNAAFQSVQFWDGRADSIETAILDHLTDPTVMGMPSVEAASVKILSVEGYRAQFKRVFRGDANPDHVLISKAIAAYVRTLITPNSPFDRYVKGEKQALSAQAVRGMQTYDAVGCTACHFGTNFSGPPVPMGEGFYELFPNYLGSRYDKLYQLATNDQGRYEATGEAIHKRLFRVPSLRNIGLTAPYFHTGSVADLGEAVRVMAKTQLQKELSDEEVSDIVAFLNTLTGDTPQ